MSNGYFTITGKQTSTSNYGTQQLGPFSVNFSDIIEIETVTVNTTATVPVPAGAGGVWIIPPLANTTPSIKYKTTSGDAGIFLNPGNVSFQNFDPLNTPTNIYLVSGGSVAVTLQFV
jgi:hypothetical protein